MHVYAVAYSLACLTDLNSSIGGNHQFPPLSTSEYNLRLTLETDMSDGKNLIVVIYNSLGWKREDAICLTVVNEAVTVHDQEGRKIETQLVPIDAYVDLSYHARAYLAVGSTSKDVHSATSPSKLSSLQPTLRGQQLVFEAKKYGFFCAATSLSSDISEGDIDKPVANDPFEVALNERKSNPLRQKSLAGNTDRRLAIEKTGMEVLISTLNQEVAVRQFLTAKVKDLEVQTTRENCYETCNLKRSYFGSNVWIWN
ncbi:hypothetical protein GOBAR_DD24298 [Gossypium barbadense]|nr:hypothetical protein GOBAR_DD24298 [Gossypium barbadense]